MTARESMDDEKATLDILDQNTKTRHCLWLPFANSLCLLREFLIMFGVGREDPDIVETLDRDFLESKPSPSSTTRITQL